MFVLHWSNLLVLGLWAHVTDGDGYEYLVGDSHCSLCNRSESTRLRSSRRWNLIGQQYTVDVGHYCRPAAIADENDETGRSDRTMAKNCRQISDRIRRPFSSLPIVYVYIHINLDYRQQYKLERWWSGVVVSALASINEVNLRWARLLLRWATVLGFNPRCRTLYFAT